MRKPRSLDIDLSNAKVLATRLPAPEPAPIPARNKYRAVASTYDGVRYASKSEARRAEYLDSLAPLGTWWVGQPKFRLGCPENVYVADFLVFEHYSSAIHPKAYMAHVEDVKGVWTPKFTRDVKLWRRYGKCALWIISRGKVQDIVTPEPTEDIG